MLFRCEAMSDNVDVPGLDSLVNTLTGEPSGPAASFPGQFGGSNRPQAVQAESSGLGISGIFDTLENLVFGNRRSSNPQPFRPPQRPPPFRPPPNRFNGRPPFRRRQNLNFQRRQDSGFRPSAPIRTKRQTRLQGNIIR